MIRRVAAAALVVCAACTPPPLPRPSPRGGERSRVCAAVRTTEDFGTDHIERGQIVEYKEYPPASGPHDSLPLQAGAYEEPLSRDSSGVSGPTIYQAVHSLEHGYVIVLYRDLAGGRLAALTERFGDARKVIIAPESQLDADVVLVAWRRKQACREPDLEAVQSFISRFREKTAPEPDAP